MSLPAILLLVLAAAAKGAEIRGAALNGNSLITWGDDIRQWRLPGLTSKVIPASPARRGEGGCILDAGAPTWGLVIEEAGRLVLRRAPRFRTEVLDPAIDMHDCVPAELYGHRGVLVLHAAQVRFYEPPAAPAERWPYREIYSIYTPSRQGGLMLTAYGLIVGNYWMRRPDSPGVAWREFAINTWSEEADSATLRFAQFGGSIAVAQGHMKNARLSLFTPPSDITQLWNELRLADDLHYPHALAAAAGTLVAGENAGPGSRLYAFTERQPARLIATTGGLHTAFIVGGRVLGIGAAGVQWYPLDKPAAVNSGAPQLRRQATP